MYCLPITRKLLFMLIPNLTERYCDVIVCFSCISWVDSEGNVLTPVYLCFKAGETIINKMIAIQLLEPLPVFATTHNHTTPSTPQLTPNLT